MPKGVPAKGYRQHKNGKRAYADRIKRVDNNLYQTILDIINQALQKAAEEHSLTIATGQLNIPDDFIQVVVGYGYIRDQTEITHMLSFSREDLLQNSNFKDMFGNKIKQMYKNVPDHQKP